MVSIEPPFELLDRHIKSERDYRYPPPPQALYDIPAEPLAFPQDPFAYDPSALYPEHAFGRSSPAACPVDERSSNLSSASAASSAVGSPQSNHDQLAQVPAWAAPQTMTVSPNIVGHPEYLGPAEYGAFTGMDEYGAFEFGGGKPPGFVGELENVSATRVPVFPQRASVSSASGLGGRAEVGQEVPVSPLSAPPHGYSAAFVPFLSPSTRNASHSPPLTSPQGWDASPRTPRGISKGFYSHSGNFVPLQSCSFSLSRAEISGSAIPQETGLTRCSDPSLIHPDINRAVPIPFDASFQPTAYPASPSLSHAASSPRPMMRTGSQSPFLHNGFQQSFSPYQAPIDPAPRRPSHPFAASPSYGDGATAFSGDEAKEKSRCPHPDCGKSFKDLKAHMLTHQNERPEKCPIGTCEYHVKGFSRKYDRNRHTLTHYKGTMVCGFCPGSGSAAEKSFNRADVFKRHLTAVHGVEQTPPNSRKKPSAGAGKRLTGGYPADATGKCSTCSQTFANAQDFYEHLDDCVLRIVQQEDPAEAVNARNLSSLENDSEVRRTLEKNKVSTNVDAAGEPAGEEDDEEMEESQDEDDEAARPARRGAATVKRTGPSGGIQKSRGMTHSRGGVALPPRRGRKHRRDYPSSWGFDKGQMTMKKRVMAVFEGPRRLAKDDMMLSTEHEVRLSLGSDGAYVTDLDVQTLKRAEGFLGGSEEEKGAWVSDDPTEEEVRAMREMLEKDA